MTNSQCVEREHKSGTSLNVSLLSPFGVADDEGERLMLWAGKNACQCLSGNRRQVRLEYITDRSGDFESRYSCDNPK